MSDPSRSVGAVFRETGGRLGVLVSRYHERITMRLLEGAQKAWREAGIPDQNVDILWVPGAFELGVAASATLDNPRYLCLIALGVVIRGETPHFEYVAGETSRILANLAAERRTPIGFGLLTVDSMEQAVARAGGDAGNKGFEAAEAALQTLDLLQWIQERRDSNRE